MSEEELYVELRKLRTGKSPEPDGMSSERLKLPSSSITPSLTMLFNIVMPTATRDVSFL